MGDEAATQTHHSQVIGRPGFSAARSSPRATSDPRAPPGSVGMATNRTTKARTRTPRPRASRSAKAPPPTDRWALALLAIGLLAGASIPILLALQGHHEDATRIALAVIDAISRLAAAAQQGSR
jgi:hypothetical protein